MDENIEDIEDINDDIIEEDPDDENDEVNDDENEDEIYEDKNSVENNIKIISSIENTYSDYYNKQKVTKSFMTKFEKAKILGVRADMLANGANAMIAVPKYVDNCYEIAKMELKEGKIPLLVRRFLPNNNIEDWRVTDLIIR